MVHKDNLMVEVASREERYNIFGKGIEDITLLLHHSKFCVLFIFKFIFYLQIR